MKLNKSLLVAVVALGLGASLIDARPQAKTPKIVKPFVNLVTFPFKAGAYLIKEVALPIIQVPVDVVKSVFSTEQE